MRHSLFALSLAVSLVCGTGVRVANAAGVTLVVLEPADAIGAGNECAGARTIVMRVSNMGTAASPPLADPIGATLTGGPLSGHAGLPAIAPGATVVVTFAVTSSLPADSAGNDVPDSSDLNGGAASHAHPAGVHGVLHPFPLKLQIVLDPTHVLGPISPTAQIPATATLGSCSPTAPASPPGLTVVGPTLGGVHAGAVATAAPGPIFVPGGIHIVPPDAPAGVRQPGSMNDCRTYGGFAGGIACLGIFSPSASNPGTVLIWNAYAQTVDGFRIYKRDGTPISPQIGANGNGVTLGYIPPNEGNCFYVTAVRSGIESAPSNPYCVGLSASTQNTTVSADRQAGYVTSRTGNTGFFANAGLGWLDPLGLLRGLIFKNGTAWSQTPIVGFEYRTHKSDLGDSYANAVARGAAHFDLRQFAGHAIYSAHLQIAVNFAYQGNDYHKSQAMCATQIGTATQLWWDETGDLSHADFSNGIAPGVQTGPYVDIDVTPIVRGWALADPGANLGFIFKNDNENLGAFTEQSCFSNFQSVNLAVTSF